MPWTRTDCVQERQRFVEEYDSGVWTMSELCERFGVSRKTGYKLLQRYEEEGEAGLVDRSRAPHSCPHRIDSQVEQAILKLKKRFPRFGARKIRWRLEDHYPQLELPARSTIGDVLQRHGLVKKKRRRTKWKHPGAAPVETTAPNQLWTVDFKGQFQTGDGVYCYPLTIVDHYSRYILRCQSLTNVRAKPSMRVFEGLFREVGLPDAIRSDNGVPFASTGIHGLCALNVWWLRLGIVHQRIMPASPQQNGTHERMHKELKDETTRPPAKNRRGQQRLFNNFVHDYNHERPHEALGGKMPASRWTASSRALPDRIAPPQYPGHFLVRRVSNNGAFRLKFKQQFLSNALKGDYVGLEEIDDGIWSIYYYDTLLGRLDERKGRISA